jgi:uncharacterized protein YdhG (YjbR/CyaY superfamily)
MEPGKIPQSVDEYIDSYSPFVRERLTEIRKAIKKAAPEAEEKISYRMPAYTLKGMLLYFAAHSNHIGFYPMTTALAAFKDELSTFKTAKGTIQFPNDKPLPLKLITDIVKFRAKENLEKAELKAGRKKII